MSSDFDAAASLFPTPGQSTGAPQNDFDAASGVFSTNAPSVSLPSTDGSVVGGLIKGAWDLPNAGAQMLDHGIRKLLPDGVAQTMDDANNYLYQKTGGVIGYPTQNLDQQISKADADYEAARAAAGRKGFDWARLAGGIPGQVALAALTGVPTTMTGALKVGALQGAASTPLTGQAQDNFWLNKALQAGWGAAGGGAGQMIANSLAPVLGSLVQKGRGFLQSNPSADVSQTAQNVVEQALKEKGLDPSTFHSDTLEAIVPSVEEALKTGGEINPKTLGNVLDAQSLPVPIDLTKGQASRDPLQWAFERDNRGINIPGIGAPLGQRFTDQNSKLIANLDTLGASTAPSPMDAGRKIISSLQGTDNAAQTQVRNAYDAFKQSAGKDLEVPMEGLAQDYASTLSDFGDKIPSAVRSKFESYGLVSGTQKKVFSIDDAESLIKTINANYDPKNAAEAKALGQLRGSVQNAIQDTTADSGLAGESAQLATNARQAARSRFSLIENVPAYKEAIQGAEPDKFFQKHVINGSVGDVRNLMGLLNPEDQTAVQAATIDHLKTLAIGNEANEGNGVFSQANYNRFVQNPANQEKLAAILTPAQLETVTKLGRVAENIQKGPVAEASNRSNTAAAIVNNNPLSNGSSGLNSVLNGVKGALNFTGLNTAASMIDFGQKAAKKGVESAATHQAVMDSLIPKVTTAAPAPGFNYLSSVLPAGAGVVMGRLSSGK